MQEVAAFEIKALITLALLKSGTSAKDIQTAVNLASTARLMAAEENSGSGRVEYRPDVKVTSIHEVRDPDCHEHCLQLEGMQSDIKTLLSLLLLQHGATPREILTTLRMAADALMADDKAASTEDVADDEAKRGRRLLTPKQSQRNELLAPVERVSRAA
jgi:hypothetical protein